MKYDARDYDNPNEYLSKEGASYSEFKKGGGKIEDISADTIKNNPNILGEIGKADDIGSLKPEQK